MAEISFYSFLIKSHHLKYRLQCFRPVISNAPAAYFPTVQDDIVLGSQNIAYVLLGHQVFHIFRFWRGKGIMGECPLLLPLRGFERTAFFPKRENQYPTQNP